MLDVKFAKDEDGIYDIQLKDGDFEMIDAFDTALEISLFTDGRADVSEVSAPEMRRGWWGDTTSQAKIGSKLWLLEQSRMVTETKNRAIDYARLALNWLIEHRYSKNIYVDSTLTPKSTLNLNINIKNEDGSTQTRTYELWKNTGLS